MDKVNDDYEHLDRYEHSDGDADADTDTDTGTDTDTDGDRDWYEDKLLTTHSGEIQAFQLTEKYRCSAIETELLDPEPSPEEIFHSAIVFNNKRRFVTMINDGFTSPTFRDPQDFLYAVCKYEAVKCAAALIRGETRLTVDIHAPCERTCFPLHVAALHGSPSTTELLLLNQAQTGVRCKVRGDIECFTLPLHFAMRSVCFDILTNWRPEHNVKRLIFSLCLPYMQYALENVALLAWTTKYTEEEFLRYVKDGKVVQVAVLLIVAWKKLRDPVITARNMLTQTDSLVGNEAKTAILQLFELFESAGDDLEAYVKRPKLFGNKRKAVTAVKYLLEQRGIPVMSQDTDLSYLNLNYGSLAGFKYLKRDYLDDGGTWPKDFFMEHYAKSGYRWTGYGSNLVKLGHKLHANIFHSPPNTKYTGVPLGFASATSMFVEAQNEVKGSRFNLLNLTSSKPWQSFASVMKYLKYR